MTLSAARKRVYEACLQMIEDRLVVGSAGNISERVDEDRFVVSPGGVAYAEVTAADFPVVSIVSGESKGPLKPTSELWLHRALYEAFPDTDAIVHTHSKYAAAFAVARIDLPFICNENIGPASEFVHLSAPTRLTGGAAR
jgi:L-fuculose-phosphate aldolase